MIKILTNECQEVNTHIHSLTVRICNKSLTGEMVSFCVNAMVCGHHEYQNIWTATSGERLKCAREIGNHCDLFAVQPSLSQSLHAHRQLCGLGGSLVFLKYPRMNIFGQATGDTPRYAV